MTVTGALLSLTADRAAARPRGRGAPETSGRRAYRGGPRRGGPSAGPAAGGGDRAPAAHRERALSSVRRRGPAGPGVAEQARAEVERLQAQAVDAEAARQGVDTGRDPRCGRIAGAFVSSWRTTTHSESIRKPVRAAAAVPPPGAARCFGPGRDGPCSLRCRAPGSRPARSRRCGLARPLRARFPGLRLVTTARRSAPAPRSGRRGVRAPLSSAVHHPTVVRRPRMANFAPARGQGVVMDAVGALTRAYCLCGLTRHLVR